MPESTPVESKSAEPTPDAYLSAGRKALRARQFSDAAAYFDRALELQPDSFLAHELRATAAFVAKDYETAAKHFREASRCDARRAEPLVNLGAVLNKLKDYRGAMEALQKSLQRVRSSPEAYYNLGLAYRGLSQPAMAVSAYKESIRLKPEFAEAHQNLGNAYLDQKNFRQAKSSFNRALELEPTLAGAKRGLEKANAMQAGSKPLSRVPTSSGIYASGISAPPVALSEIQRAADREIVHEATKRVERSVLAWITELRSEIEPNVGALGRAVTNGDFSDATRKATGQLSAGVRDADDLAKLLREARLLLEEHERDILGGP